MGYCTYLVITFTLAKSSKTRVKSQQEAKKAKTGYYDDEYNTIGRLFSKICVFTE